MNDAKDIKYRKKIQKKNFFNKVVKKILIMTICKKLRKYFYILGIFEQQRTHKNLLK